MSTIRFQFEIVRAFVRACVRTYVRAYVCVCLVVCARTPACFMYDYNIIKE